MEYKKYSKLLKNFLTKEIPGKIMALLSAES